MVWLWSVQTACNHSIQRGHLLAVSVSVRQVSVNLVHNMRRWDYLAG